MAAIADQVVKTPVLVGRSDDRTDPLTKLQDGVRLLELKERAIARYAQQNGLVSIKPLMLVVAPTIDEADEISSIVDDISFFEGRYADRVLTVHSNVRDVALEQLESLEDPTNPYQIVISVGMLKEGWDVKNVYVIASLRASVSEILTEQTLGRGLRLPFGRYTGIEILDTLEVLGHERYAELLRKANVLNETFVDRRTRAVLRRDQYGEYIPVRETVEVQVEIAGIGEPDVPPYDGKHATSTGNIRDDGQLTIRDVSGSVKHAEADIRQLEMALLPRDDVPKIRIPYLRMTQVTSRFSLADVTDLEPFRQLGRRIAADPSGALRRVTVSARVVTGRDGLRRTEMVTAPAVDQIVSPAVTRPLFDARNLLLDFVLHSSIVPSRATEQRPAEFIVDAFIDGLGSNAEAVLSAAMDRAASELTRLIQLEHHRYVQEPDISEVLEFKTLDRVRRSREALSADRYGTFERNVGYEGYRKSLYAHDWFDSSPERDVANVLDESNDISVWARLQHGDTPILWRGAREYQPDFVVVELDGTHWLLEVKADRDIDREEIVLKRRAAQRWTNHANANLNDGTTWKYGLVGEREVAAANGQWNVLRQSAQ